MRRLLVEDERKAREGMATLVPWAELGFESVLTAPNGLEAPLEKEAGPAVARAADGKGYDFADQIHDGWEMQDSFSRLQSLSNFWRARHYLCGRTMYTNENISFFLMDEVQRAEPARQRQELEMRLLQSQIKPHFLCNTQDLICWRLDMAGDESGARYVQSPARFRRIGLCRGNGLIPPVRRAAPRATVRRDPEFPSGRRYRFGVQYSCI